MTDAASTAVSELGGHETGDSHPSIHWDKHWDVNGSVWLNAVDSAQLNRRYSPQDVGPGLLRSAHLDQHRAVLVGCRVDTQSIYSETADYYSYFTFVEVNLRAYEFNSVRWSTSTCNTESAFIVNASSITIVFTFRFIQ